MENTSVATGCTAKQQKHFWKQPLNFKPLKFPNKQGKLPNLFVSMVITLWTYNFAEEPLVFIFTAINEQYFL